jgi:hypothetical protein
MLVLHKYVIPTEQVLIAGILMLLFCVSCQSKREGYLNGFERLVEEVEHNVSSLSQEQWEQYDGQMRVFINRYGNEKHNLSLEDKKKVGELTARYYKARVESLGFKILGDIGNWMAFIQGFIEEIKEDIENYQNQ